MSGTDPAVAQVDPVGSATSPPGRKPTNGRAAGGDETNGAVSPVAAVDESPSGGPVRRTRHRLTVLADQAMSSLSNVVVSILVARTTSPTTFGKFALTMVGYQLALSVIRSTVGEPLLSQYAMKGPRARREVESEVHGATIFLGIGCSLVLAVVAMFCGPGLRGSCLALALVLPFVLAQDMWRYLFVFDRPAAALGIDLVWLIGVVLTLTLVPSGSGPAPYVLAWGAGGALGALAGFALGWGIPAWPHPWRWIARNRELSWRYLTESAMANGVSQLTFIGLAGISGAAAVGAARAATVVYGALGIAHQGLYMALVPEGARQLDRPERLRKLFVLASVLVMTLSLVWMFAGIAAPTSWGIRLFGDTWPNADPLLLPMGLTLIAGGAITGGLLGTRALGNPRRSLSARLRSTPFQLVCPLVGAVLGDAEGFVFGLAIANVVTAGLWWMAFLQATPSKAEAEI